jgi:hypothetical protein
VVKAGSVVLVGISWSGKRSTFDGGDNLEYSCVCVPGQGIFGEIGVFVESGFYLGNFGIILKSLRHYSIFIISISVRVSFQRIDFI